MYIAYPQQSYFIVPSSWRLVSKYPGDCACDALSAAARKGGILITEDELKALGRTYCTVVTYKDTYIQIYNNK